MKTTIKEIWTYDGPLDEAFCPQSVTFRLADDIDISRGDMIVGLENLPGCGSDLHARVCWMHQRPLQPGKKYLLQARHPNRRRPSSPAWKAASTWPRSNRNRTPPALAINDIGVLRLKLSKPIVFDGYTTNRLTGSFILIEQGTNATVAAGMLSPPTEAVKPEYTDFAI